MGGASSDSGHHALVLSLSDLSVWCYACASYVKHDRLLLLLVRAEAMYVCTSIDSVVDGGSTAAGSLSTRAQCWQAGIIAS